VVGIEADNRRVNWRDVCALLLAAPGPDPDFAADLADIRGQRTPMLDPWECPRVVAASPPL
jgi:hypothetical protein